MPLRGSDRGTRMGKLGGQRKLAAFVTAGDPWRKGIVFALLALTLLSCSGFPIRDDRPRGIYHRVRSGETLSIIARAYRVDLQELAEINNIDNPGRIAADDVIFIPDAQQIVDDVMVAARPQIPPRPAPAVEPPARTEAEVLKPETPRKEPVGTVRPKEIKPKETRPAITARQREPRPAERAKPREPGPVEAVKPRPTVPAEKVKPREAAPAAVVKGPEEQPSAAEREPAGRPLPAKPEKEEIAAAPAPPAESDRNAERIRFDKKRFIWPVKGRVVSRFGIQPNRIYSQGIRIAAAEGEAVQAAADGLVIFSALLKEFGETIIIEHEGQYATVYTRLGVRTVRAESRVRKGDRIAFLGKGENREEPSLHFEVRYKNKARNPLFFLP